MLFKLALCKALNLLRRRSCTQNYFTRLESIFAHESFFGGQFCDQLFSDPRFARTRLSDKQHWETVADQAFHEEQILDRILIGNENVVEFDFVSRHILIHLLDQFFAHQRSLIKFRLVQIFRDLALILLFLLLVNFFVPPDVILVNLIVPLVPQLVLRVEKHGK